MEQEELKKTLEDTENNYQQEDAKEVLEEEDIEDKKKSGKFSFLAELLVYLIIVVLCLFVVPKYVIQRTVVDGTSMLNTLEDGDSLMVEKVSYHLGNPKRFDIIVFYPYGRDDDRYFVKRIIGMPGETIQIIGDDIYIDGELLEEDYGKDPMTRSGTAQEPLKLADDEYFVLGDNREISLDSRYEEVGPVKRNLIEGRVIFRIYPFDSFGTID